jgi:hypothetical protein
MIARNTVFSVVDLFHEILNFLPRASPVTLRSVSKEWYYRLKGYKLPNFDVYDEMWLKLGDFNPCSIIIEEIRQIPQNIIQTASKLYITSMQNNKGELTQLLPRFLNTRELILDIHDFYMAYIFSLTLRKLTVNCLREFNGSLAFDGSKFERLEYLDIRSINVLDCNKVKLPPNLITLYSARTTILPNNPEYFPATMREIRLRSAKGEALSKSLPRNIQYLECDNLDSIPQGVKWLEVYKSTPLVLDNLLSFVSHEITHYEHFNFKRITSLKINNKYKFNVIDLPPTLTDLQMNVSSYMPLETNHLPYSLLSLKLSIDQEYKPRFVKLPPRLRVLYLSYKLHDRINLIPNDFPDSLTDLTIKCNYVTIRKGDLPPNLRRLRILFYTDAWNLQGDTMFEPHSIPQSVTSLDVPDYTRTFEHDVLPEGLTFLQRHNIDIPKRIPRSLEYIHYSGGKIDIKHRMELEEHKDGRKYYPDPGYFFYPFNLVSNGLGNVRIVPSHAP